MSSVQLPPGTTSCTSTTAQVSTTSTGPTAPLAVTADEPAGRRLSTSQPHTPTPTPLKPVQAGTTTGPRDDKQSTALSQVDWARKPAEPLPPRQLPRSAFQDMRFGTVLRHQGERMMFVRVERNWTSPLQQKAELVASGGARQFVPLDDKHLGALTQQPVDGLFLSDTVLHHDDFEHMPTGALLRHRGGLVEFAGYQDETGLAGKERVVRVVPFPDGEMTTIRIKPGECRGDLTATLVRRGEPAARPRGPFSASGKTAAQVFRGVDRWIMGGAVAYKLLPRDAKLKGKDPAAALWYVPLRPALAPGEAGGGDADTLVPGFKRVPVPDDAWFTFDQHAMILDTRRLHGLTESPRVLFTPDDKAFDPDGERAMRVSDEELALLRGQQTPARSLFMALRLAREAERQGLAPTPARSALVPRIAAHVPTDVAKLIASYMGSAVRFPSSPADWRTLREGDIVVIEGTPALVARDVSPTDDHVDVLFPKSDFHTVLETLATASSPQVLDGIALVRYRLPLPPMPAATTPAS